MDAYKMIQEDKELDYQTLVSITIAARTPMDKKGGKAMNDYVKSLRAAIEKTYAQWKYKEREEEIRERLKRPPQSRVYGDAPGSMEDEELLRKKLERARRKELGEDSEHS